jgi:Abortive infection C-terminus
MSDLISKRTRQEFREYFVGTTLGIISDAFDAEDVVLQKNYVSPVSGARRSLVEQYYRSVDWRNPTDVGRILNVFESVLIDLEEAGNEVAQRSRTQLLRHLQRDGIEFNAGRLSLPSWTVHWEAARSIAARLDLPALQLQIERIATSIDSDPARAIGTAKEMIETTCKSILSARGESYTKSADIPSLVKQTRKILKLLPEDVPDSARGADSIRQLLNQLGSVAQNVAELRGLYGTGHGKEGKSRGLQPRHARLVVGSAATLAIFLLETHEHQPGGRPNDQPVRQNTLSPSGAADESTNARRR